jgi:hypothetical protein
MRKGATISPAWFLVLMGSAMVSAASARAQDQQVRPIVIRELQHDTSSPLRDIAIPVRPSASTPRLAPLARPTGPMLTSSEPDLVAQSPGGRLTGITTLLNFDGQNADSVAPPDTNGVVGATQFVQWVNVEYNVYDKKSGALILGPIQGNSFWSGFGGSCETRNDGDIIIQYDKGGGPLGGSPTGVRRTFHVLHGGVHHIGCHRYLPSLRLLVRQR